MSQVKTKDIILYWIEARYKSHKPIFFSYEFEEQLPAYGRLAHQKHHTASTYSRAFRKLRESNTLWKHGYELTEITEHKNKKVKGWKIEKIDM